MLDKPANACMSYAVTVTRQDERQAVAAARGHELTLNIKKGDGSVGFNAAETLLAALGARVLTNVNAIAAKMRLYLNDAQMRFTAVRQDEPPILTKTRVAVRDQARSAIHTVEVIHDTCMVSALRSIN
jgi:uncharacterized OsmC-like protein